MYEEFGYYAVIPIKILKDKKISANAKLLYAFLTGLVKERGYCWASNEHLAKELDVSERQVQYLLNELKKEKYTKIEISDCKYRKIYLTNCK